MRIQQVRKVRRQRRPGYPTRPEVVRDPELLRRHVPSTWRKSAQVTAALSIMLAAGCQHGDPLKGGASKRVAPIFAHGNGRGTLGCVMVTPPTFLSEQDAVQLIAEELGKAGLSMSQTDVTLEKVLVPRIKWAKHDPKDKEPKTIQETHPLVMDLVNAENTVAVEYVGMEDYLQLGGEPARVSIQAFDFQTVAGKVAGVIGASRKAPKMRYGVFYDPIPVAKYPEWPGRENAKKVAEWGEECKKIRAKALEDSKELLRAQVRDFIEWLKGQGAI